MKNVRKEAIRDARKKFVSFIGVDLHKTAVTLRAVDVSENVISSLTIDTKCVDKIEAWINALPKPRWLAVEAVGFAEWFIDRYRDCVDRIDIADAIEFWAGLTPDNQESAGRTQSGNITKAGSATLRWALCKAAVTFCRSDARQETVRQRLIKRIGKPKANVAMGRRLLRTLYAMFRDGTLYQRGEPTNHLKNANKARAKKSKHKNEAA